MDKVGLARKICYLLAAVLVLACMYCLLWVLSSSSMAFTDCDGKYDLFATDFRCRQPPIAALLALASFVGAVAFALVGRMRFKG